MSGKARKVIPIEQDRAAHARVERINARFRLHVGNFNKRAKALRDGLPRMSVQEAFAALYGLIDDVTALNGDDVACRRGCSHCCHIAVAVTNVEASILGQRLGTAPRNIPHQADFTNFPYGYSKPCTFLIMGECSIYENRPVPCRIHYSLAETPDPCKQTAEHYDSSVHYMNFQIFDTMGAEIALHYAGASVTLGELRDFFPNGKGGL